MELSISIKFWEIFYRKKGFNINLLVVMLLAERKNWHLLKVARAIMFSMHVPKYLWGYAILAVSYLINRMPTSVLKYRTPLECFKNFSLECWLISDLPLKIFWCTMFVHIPNRPQSKLDLRAEKCVLIGYTPNKRGY